MPDLTVHTAAGGQDAANQTLHARQPDRETRELAPVDYIALEPVMNFR